MNEQGVRQFDVEIYDDLHDLSHEPLRPPSQSGIRSALSCDGWERELNGEDASE